MQKLASEQAIRVSSNLQRFPLALALLIGLLATPSVPAATMPTQAQIMSDMTLANNYFTNKWRAPGCDTCLSGNHSSDIWTRATYFEGSLALYRINHDTAITNYATRWGDFHQWTLRYSSTSLTADEQCAGSEFIELYLLDRTKPYRITNIVANLNYWMFTNSSKLDYYWYIDGVHMSMPAFAKMAAISGSTNANYSSKMYSYWNYCKSTIGPAHGLYNATDHLWYRDTNYVSGYKAQDGTTQKCYWSRGNGWVFAGLARVLDVLPPSDAHFGDYQQVFTNMAAALKSVQRPDGFWNVNLGYTNDYPGPESSGTAMFTYGLAWGINHGYLDSATYLQTVIDGWSALSTGALHHTPPDTNGGFIGYVQSSGKQPADSQPITYYSVPDFDDFTLGALLLAGTEVYQLAGHSQAITFGALANRTYGDAAFALSASASSGLPVSFSILSGPASLAGNVLTITGAGTVTVRASQAGDANWDPAPNVDEAFTVNPKPLTVTGTLSVPASKVYDGTTSASGSGTAALQAAEALGTGTSSDGKPYSVDSVSLSGAPSYAYNSKDVATANTVNAIGLSLTGSGSGNYTVSAPSFSATITRKALTMSGLSVPATKAYDGTTTAVVTGSPGTLQTAEAAGTGTTDDGRRYSVDSVSLTGTATGTYNSPDVASANTVTFAGVSLTGTGSGNYTLTIQSPVSATITGRSLTVTATGVNKVYEGTTAATVTLSDNRVSGDVFTASYTSASFADKDAGTGKAVSVSGISISGADAGNYALANTTAAATATITALPVQLSGSRVYDGTTAAAATSLSIVNKIADDDVTLSGSATLTGKDVGSRAVSTGTGLSRVRYTTGSVNNGTSISMTALGASPAPGDTLVAVISTRGTSQSRVTGVTQTGATWSRVTQSGAGTTTGSTTEIWYAPNVSAGAGTAITINLATTLRAAAVVVEYSGLLTPTSVDVSANNYSAGTAGTTATTGTTAGTAQASELWVGGIGLVSSSYTLGTPQNSFSRITDVSSGSGTSGNNARVYALEKMVTATGTASSGGTISASSQWSGAVAAFKAAPSSALTLAGTDALDYTLTGMSGSVAISAKALTVTGLSVPASKVYDGTTDAATPTGSAGLQTAEAAGSGTSDDGSPYTGDTVSITGTAAGTYNAADVPSANLVTFTGLSTANGNYSLTPPTQAATITPRPLTAALTGIVSKTYDGTPAAILTAGNYSLPGVLSGDSVGLNNPGSGTYDTRDAGTSRTVSVTGLAISGPSADNYTLSSPSASGAVGTISKLPITVAAVAETKTYDGTTSASETPTITPALASGDSATTLSQAFETKDAGTANKIIIPSIVINDGNSGNNYTVTLQNFMTGTINPAALTITADPKTKVYGDADPALTYQLSGGSLASGDSLTGDLTRAPGENAGAYAIQQGTVTAGANYNLAYVSANVLITRRELLAQADDAGRAYGQTNPVFTVTYTGFTGADTVTNLLELPQAGTLADTNSPIGTYDISLLGGSDTNYSLVLSNGTLTVTAAALTVTADAQSKTYGDSDPAFTWQITSGALMNTDSLQGVLGRETGEVTGIYAIQQGTLTAGTNYTLTFLPANLTINPKAITVSADPKTKVYGEADPALTCQVAGGLLVLGDSLSGDLTRATGENVGPYAILQGTVTAGTNYTLAFVSADLTINPKPITVTANPKSKVYGDSDPALTYQLTGGSLVSGDSLTGDLTRAAGENAGAYAIQQGTVTAGANYNLNYQGADLTISQASSASAFISSQNPSAQGSDVTFTATLTAVLPATTTPTGTVQFTVNDVAFGSPVPLDGNGVASFSTALLASGSNTVAAAYSGDLNFLGSTSSLVQAVNLTLETPSALAIKDNGDGTVTLTFQGTPGGKYVIQAAEDLGASSWQSFSTNTAGADGRCTLTTPTTEYRQQFFHPTIP